VGPDFAFASHVALFVCVFLAPPRVWPGPSIAAPTEERLSGPKPLISTSGGAVRGEDC